MDPNAVLDKVMRLGRLDTTVFDEVKDDLNETVPAIVIVAIASLVAGIGVWLWLLVGGPEGYDVDFANLLVNVWLLGTIFSVVLWAIWVAVTYVVLVQVYKESVDFQTLLRPMGYAAIPLTLTVFMVVSGVALGIGIVAMALWFVFAIYATQAASNASSDRVVVATTAGFAVYCIVMAFLGSQTGMTTGVFSTDPDAVFEGEYVDLPTADDFDFD
ncbi:MAG: YIP1 family protein [Tepidiformaceae bacterium]